MKREFVKPIIKNFVTTKQGYFPLSDLTEEELTRYADEWCQALKEKYELLKVRR